MFQNASSHSCFRFISIKKKIQAGTKWMQGCGDGAGGVAVLTGVSLVPEGTEWTQRLWRWRWRGGSLDRGQPGARRNRMNAKVVEMALEGWQSWQGSACCQKEPNERKGCGDGAGGVAVLTGVSLLPEGTEWTQRLWRWRWRGGSLDRGQPAARRNRMNAKVVEMALEGWQSWQGSACCQKEPNERKGCGDGAGGVAVLTGVSLVPEGTEWTQRLWKWRWRGGSLEKMRCVPQVFI